MIYYYFFELNRLVITHPNIFIVIFLFFFCSQPTSGNSNSKSAPHIFLGINNHPIKNIFRVKSKSFANVMPFFKTFRNFKEYT